MKANNDVDSLKQTILEYDNTGQSANAKLLTDDKVLARVTDGIYRQPGSALRELISNAYDADAENVYIDTGSPRFETMTIKDDGNGMSIDTLLNLISHIGGSAKRNTMGTQLGVNNIEDMSKSPNKKRKLIGKIGIGLFSVAQLTREFEIITKEKDTDFYLKALITLHNYSDDSEPVNSKRDERGESFETGNVEIWTEKTKNFQSHGTDIILRDIKKSARDVLKSLDIWGQTEAQTESDDNDVDILDSAKLVIPSFHIGCATGKSGLEIYDSEKFHEPKLPWELTDSRDEKFKKLYSSVLGLTAKTVNPKLNIVLDNFFICYGFYLYQFRWII